MSRREMAIDFLELASSGKVDDAYEKYVHSDFIHHNAYYKGDRETLRKGMQENAARFPGKKCEVLRTLEDGALVAVHSRITLDAGAVFGVIHIFRFQDDKIVEEWEAGQELLTDSPNEHGIF